MTLYIQKSPVHQEHMFILKATYRWERINNLEERWWMLGFKIQLSLPFSALLEIAKAPTLKAICLNVFSWVVMSNVSASLLSLLLILHVSHVLTQNQVPLPSYPVLNHWTGCCGSTVTDLDENETQTCRQSDCSLCNQIRCSSCFPISSGWVWANHLKVTLLSAQSL